MFKTCKLEVFWIADFECEVKSLKYKIAYVIKYSGFKKQNIINWHKNWYLRAKKCIAGAKKYVAVPAILSTNLTTNMRI